MNYSKALDEEDGKTGRPTASKAAKPVVPRLMAKQAKDMQPLRVREDELAVQRYLAMKRAARDKAAQEAVDKVVHAGRNITKQTVKT